MDLMEFSGRGGSFDSGIQGLRAAGVGRQASGVGFVFSVSLGPGSCMVPELLTEISQ